MNTNDRSKEVAVQAANALSALLGQMSAIKTWKIRFRSQESRKAGTDIVAHLDVLGHSHKLVCRVADGQPGNVKNELRKLRTQVTPGQRDTTPVLIAPYLTPRARALCDQNQVGFIDLEGNARLVVDEVFIGKRSCQSVSAHVAEKRLFA